MSLLRWVIEDCGFCPGLFSCPLGSLALEEASSHAVRYPIKKLLYGEVLNSLASKTEACQQPQESTW